MERKIGEIFEYNGEWYQCVTGRYCHDCAFNNDSCEERERITLKNQLTKEQITGLCISKLRSDKKPVIFKKLEKVGEPFTSEGKLYQHYKVFDIDNVYGDVFWCVHNYKAKTLSIELKQNKEDMEEKKLNLKPFDIQKAKEGKPVCTRDGRKARIICFDKRGGCPIIALVEPFVVEYDCIREETYYYTTDGCAIGENTESKDNLMMLPEKKEGWVNVYYDNDASSHRGCRAIYDTKEQAVKYLASDKQHIATVKIEWEEQLWHGQQQIKIARNIFITKNQIGVMDVSILLDCFIALPYQRGLLRNLQTETLHGRMNPQN